MESYRTEEEQVEALKKWWRENGSSTLLAIALGLALVFGWQAWRDNSVAKQEAASAVYQNLLAAVQGNNGEMSTEQTATAKHLIGTLREDYAGSAYASYAALFEARFAVAEKDYAAAEQALRAVIDANATEELVQIATLRLARVLAADGRSDDALALLSANPTGFGAAFAEARGDIHLLAGNQDLAREAYEQAQAEGGDGMRNPLLAMKLAELGIKAGE